MSGLPHSLKLPTEIKKKKEIEWILEKKLIRNEKKFKEDNVKRGNFLFVWNRKNIVKEDFDKHDRLFVLNYH